MRVDKLKSNLKGVSLEELSEMDITIENLGQHSKIGVCHCKQCNHVRHNTSPNVRSSINRYLSRKRRQTLGEHLCFYYA